MGAELFHADRRTDMTKLLVTFRKFAYALLRHQGLEHMPQMHRSLYAYCSTLVPPVILDFPTSAARRLHVHTKREILAAKGGTVGENVSR